MKKHWKIILSAAAVYVLLLVLLVAAESGSPEASIHSFWDAVWFSLITMTTVGYGDLSPVTAAGRLIGLIFALCSIGVLSAMVGLFLRLLGGKMMPRLQLRLGGKRRWVLFNEENEDSLALAKEFLRTEPDTLLIFPKSGEAQLQGRNVIRMDVDAEELLRLRRTDPEGIRGFFLAEDGWRNAREATLAAEQGIAAFCMSRETADTMPEGLHLFSRNDLLSRCYWKEHPLRKDESCVVIIGCEEAGNALLQRALLTNVFEADRKVEYHVFASDGAFEKDHPLLTADLGTGGTDGDSLRFYQESWETQAELLQRADRILICHDSDEKNLSVYNSLRAWFPTGATVHVRLSLRSALVPSFGCSEEIITREFVERDAVNDRAQLMHRIYSMGSSKPVPWEKLSEFLRQSNIAAADHVPVKVRFLLDDDILTDPDPETLRKASECFRKMSGEARRPLLEMEHRRWMRFYRLYNWEYDPVRNDGMRHHPMILPFEKLSMKEQQKDAYAWDILGRLTEE